MPSQREIYPSTWVPTDVLELCDDGRCIGYAPSKRRKCLNPISYANSQALNSLVEKIANQQPDPVLLRPILEQMAVHGLCQRNHKPQVHEMMEKWADRIMAAFP
ncbi:hypothetical protein P153DRAFT_301855, partial [Dothidotthia symphoricarpi CBS 119687]